MAYIARNKYGTLRWYENMPTKEGEDGEFVANGDAHFLRNDLFPEVTWSNSPQEIVLKPV